MVQQTPCPLDPRKDCFVGGVNGVGNVCGDGNGAGAGNDDFW